jgi:hypothetical protein
MPHELDVEQPSLCSQMRCRRLTPHSLKVIVHPMLSQFYGMFLGFHLGWKTDRIMQVKFPLFPRDNCMSSPDPFFIIRRDRDYVATMYDVFHREQSKTANLEAITESYST